METESEQDGVIRLVVLSDSTSECLLMMLSQSIKELWCKSLRYKKTTTTEEKSPSMGRCTATARKIVGLGDEAGANFLMALSIIDVPFLR